MSDEMVQNLLRLKAHIAKFKEDYGEERGEQLVAMAMHVQGETKMPMDECVAYVREQADSGQLNEWLSRRTGDKA